MLHTIRLAAMVVAFFSACAFAEEPLHPEKPLGFLELGKDYVIRFPDSYSTFRYSESGVTKATSSDGSSRPASWTMNVDIQVFTVRKHAHGAWVLLEHPASIQEATKWNYHRMAVAELTKHRIKELQSSADGRAELERLKRLASQKIETSRTWVNLDHAVTVSDVPTKLNPVSANMNTFLGSK